MARPKKHKRICSEPEIREFNSGRDKGAVSLTVEEYETVRLIDHAGLTQKECAKQMQVARTTVTAIYDSARYKISDSIVGGKALKVDGGDYELCENSKYCCGQCGKSKCGRCRHGSCERCIGIFREPGMECFVVQYN